MLSELSLFLYDFADVWEYQRTGGNVRRGDGGNQTHGVVVVVVVKLGCVNVLGGSQE